MGGQVRAESADVRPNWPKVGFRVIRRGFCGAMPIMVRALALAVLIVAGCPALAAAAPEPGPWTGPPVSAGGARAVVSFIVDPGSGLLQPAVRYRCGARRGHVPLGLAARTGRRFAVVHRRLRLAGRFDSAFEAHGTVRIRGRRACRLSWTASAGAPLPLEEIEEPIEDVGEELDEDEFDENDEPIEDEDEPVEDDEPRGAAALPFRTPPPT
jgi:hypothetical protein